MRVHTLLTMVAVIALAGCAGNADKMDLDTTIGNGAIVDTSSIDDPIANGQDFDANAPTPGTQGDLVVNVGDRVFFETDSSDLTAIARRTLEDQATWLAEYSNVSIMIEGHADERGTREYNLALGERRANSVKNYLVALGVAPSRIETITFGKERPAVPGMGSQAWSQNRRGVSRVQ